MTNMHDTVGRGNYDASRTQSKGGIRRVAAALVLALALLAVFAPNASASIHWCRVEPRVQIGGYDVYVFATGTDGTNSTLSNKMAVPDEIFIRYPVGVSYSLTSTDPGVGGYGQNVNNGALGSLTGSNGGTIQVQVSVLIKTFGTHPVLVQIGDQWVEGNSNVWVTLNATISADQPEPAVLGGDGVCCN